MSEHVGASPNAIMGIIGSSGSGKTTLLANLIPVLIGQGFSVSTLKHSHHDFDMDQPGKDSYRHREAGAQEVMLMSDQRWALLHEARQERRFEIHTLLARMSPVDIVLIEGFKKHDYPKIEVYRSSVGKVLLSTPGDRIVAVATDSVDDKKVAALNVPILNLSDMDSIAKFIVSYLKI